MVIGLLDDHTYCALYAFIRMRGTLAKAYTAFIASPHSQPIGTKMWYVDIFVDLRNGQAKFSRLTPPFCAAVDKLSKAMSCLSCVRSRETPEFKAYGTRWHGPTQPPI